VRKADEKQEFKSGNLLDKIKVVGRKIVRFNPAFAVMRSGALAGIRINIFGIATRLYPAFINPEQAVSKKIKPESIQPAKNAWTKVSNFWKKIGGNATTLEQAIRGAWFKPVFKWTKKAKARAGSGFDGDDFSYVAGEVSFGSIATGMSILTSIVGLIKDTKKNPLQTSNPDLENVEVPAPTETPEELEKFAQDTSEGGIPPDGEDDGKILGIPKVAFWIGVGAITLIGGYLVYKKITSKK